MIHNSMFFLNSFSIFILSFLISGSDRLERSALFFFQEIYLILLIGNSSAFHFFFFIYLMYEFRRNIHLLRFQRADFMCRTLEFNIFGVRGGVWYRSLLHHPAECAGHCPLSSRVCFTLCCPECALSLDMFFSLICGCHISFRGRLLPSFWSRKPKIQF